MTQRRFQLDHGRQHTAGTGYTDVLTGQRPIARIDGRGESQIVQRIPRVDLRIVHGWKP